jgi:anti-sigma-K factor RskA
MISLPNNDDAHLLAAAYALDALDDVERRRFEQHLGSCESCQEEVASLRPIVDELALTTAQAPPASLRAKVVTDIDRTRQVSAIAGSAKPGASLRRLAAVAAVAVALGLGSFALQQRSRANRLAQSAAITEAPDARVVELSGSGSAQFTYSATVGQGLLSATNLTPSAAGRTYQAWIITDGVPRSLGTFRASSNRAAKLRVRTALPPGAVVAVTDEPAGGSAQPTTTPLLASTPA